MTQLLSLKVLIAILTVVSGISATIITIDRRHEARCMQMMAEQQAEQKRVQAQFEQAVREAHDATIRTLEQEKHHQPMRLP